LKTVDTGFIDLDILLTRIRHPQSKVYFLDAVKAYKAGALRGALTSTWVALAYDLIAIVDADDSGHTDDQLRKWKADHETMVSEVRSGGYSRSLALLQADRMEPQIAKKIIASMEDRRSLWITFDAEFPDRVRQSLDELRSRLTTIRGDLLDGNSLDGILFALTKTILKFFNTVESSDLRTLRCNANDPEWVRFSEALAALRKAIGLQIANIADAYGIELSKDLQYIAPVKL